MKNVHYVPVKVKGSHRLAAAVKMSTSRLPGRNEGKCEKQGSVFAREVDPGSVQTRAAMLMVLLSKMTLTSEASSTSPRIFPPSALFVYVYHCCVRDLSDLRLSLCMYALM